MYNLKKIIFCLLCALLFTNLSHAQQKDWQKLTGLLQKEAAYFEGKNGFVQLGKSEYNAFHIEKLSVNDTMAVSGMWFRDRFENHDSKRYLEEIVVFYDYDDYIIQSVQIVYDYAFYFEDFPDVQFLLIEFDDTSPLTHQTISVYKNVKTGEENKTTMEDTVHQIVVPIRRKNRSKILKVIDQYQKKTLKKQLIDDRRH